MNVMNESDKKQMNDIYMNEISTNKLDARPHTALGFIKGYEKAFSLYIVSKRISKYWMYSALCCLGYILIDIIRYVC